MYLMLFNLLFTSLPPFAIGDYDDDDDGEDDDDKGDDDSDNDDANDD